VFTRWRRVSDADLEDVLGRFETTLLEDVWKVLRGCLRSKKAHVTVSCQ
jgi:hypothetical protein